MVDKYRGSNPNKTHVNHCYVMVVMPVVLNVHNNTMATVTFLEVKTVGVIVKLILIIDDRLYLGFFIF